MSLSSRRELALSSFSRKIARFKHSMFGYGVLWIQTLNENMFHGDHKIWDHREYFGIIENSVAIFRAELK